MAAPMNHMILLKKLFILGIIASCAAGLGYALPSMKQEVLQNRLNDVCTIPSCSPSELSNSSVVADFCTEHNYTVSGRCCAHVINDTNIQIFGVDLSKCTMTNTTALRPLKQIKWIVLEDNPDLNQTNFGGLSGIEYLSLPPDLDCPGGDESWGRVTHNTVTICRHELDTCLVKNVSCPAHVSSCRPDGPGESLCLCDEGRHGYKCLRTSYFPSILFVLTLGGSTLVFSVFLGVTQRIRVKKKKDR